MKSIIRLLSVIAFFSFSFASCTSLSEDETFEAEMIVGTWECNGLYETYNADLKTGETWDTTVDETQADAHAFTWTLESNGDLLQIHIMEIGGEVPRPLTVTELTLTTLTYEDLGESYTFTKVRP